MSVFLPSTTTVAILLLGGTVLLAFGSDALASRFRIPDVLWLILFGLLAGPVFHVVAPQQVTELGAILGTAALILILYDAGIDFNIHELRTVGPTAALLGFGSFGLSALLLFGLAYGVFAPGDATTAILFALALAGVSGAVTLPIALRLRFPGSIPSLLSLEFAIEDTLAVLSVTILITILATGGGAGGIVPAVVLPLPLAIAFGLLGGFVAIQFLSRWQNRAFAGLATMGLLFVVYAAAESLGGSGIMAALVMGIVLGNDAFFRRWLPRSSRRLFTLDPSVRQVHNDIAFVLRALFLVFLGILVPFQPLGALAVAAVIALPIALFFLRRFLLAESATRGRLPASLVDRLAGLYGRGLTNAVLLILAIDLLPAGPSAALAGVLLPAFLIIIGTDIAMTVLVFLKTPPDPLAPRPTMGRPVSAYAPLEPGAEVAPDELPPT